MKLTAAILWAILGAQTIWSAPAAYRYFEGKANWKPARPITTWAIPDQTLPSEDLPVVGCSVRDFGAKADGVTDDTNAFQSALLHMAEAGGGVVWAPSGRYAIRGNLVIPVNVTLRGEWAPPQEGKEGTVLQAYAGRGSEDADCFILIYANGGLRGVTIWYPEQSIEAPVAYPWTIQRREMVNFKPCMTVQEVTIVNGWKGIEIGSQTTTNGNWLLRRLYLTTIKSGIETDMTDDIGRLYDVTISPNIWLQSPIAEASKGASSKSTAIALMKKGGVGITIGRHDFTHHGPFIIEGCAIGLRGKESGDVKQEKAFAAFGSGQFQGHFYRSVIRNCGVAVQLTGMHPAGTVFTDCQLEGDRIGVSVGPCPKAPLLFNRCSISGGEAAIENRGLWAMSVNASSLSGEVRNASGAIALVGGEIKVGGDKPALRLTSEVAAATVQGVVGLDLKRIEGWRSDSGIQFSAAAVAAMDSPNTKLDYAQPCSIKPAGRTLSVVAGVPRDGTADVSAAVQSALNDVAKVGGGVAFLPPGVYRVEKPLRIPAGVELRGVNDGSHHLAKSATLLQIYSGRGDPTGAAAISLESKSGISGIGFVYPEMDWRNLEKFSYLFRGLGKEIYLTNLAVGGVDQLVDFSANRCDRHFVDNVLANPLRVGVSVGSGSAGGKIFNCHFITHAWSLARIVWAESAIQKVFATSVENIPAMDETSAKAHAELLRSQLRAFVLDDVANETLFFNFTYASLSGLDAGGSGGKGPEAAIFNHGTDVSIYGMRVKATGGLGLELTNYMVYGLNWEKAVAAQTDAATQVRIYPRSFQAVGPMRNAIDLKGSDVVFEQPLFNIGGREGILVQSGDMCLTAPVFYLFERKPQVTFSEPSAKAEIVGGISAVAIAGKSMRAVSETRKSLIQRGCVINPHATNEK